MDDLDPAVLETMVETVGVGVAIYGADGTYRYVNGAYASLLGVDREELVGTQVWEVAVDLEADRFDGYWDSFADGETRTAETDHRYGGRSVPVATVTTRQRIEGTPYNFGTVRDITERKARERELRRQNERLDSFASVVAHDLRNPLNVAMAQLELLQGDIDREEVDTLESTLDRMEAMIDDLLTFAREGDSLSETEPVSLREAATGAWDVVRAPGADLTIADDATLAADGARLQQLFENLFANAVDHGSEDVAVRVGTLPGGFYVADDGPGIPGDERASVFEPGYTTADAGTGLGLPIVQEVAEAHGWSVRVTDAEWPGETSGDGSETETGGGARFEVTGVSRPG